MRGEERKLVATPVKPVTGPQDQVCLMEPLITMAAQPQPLEPVIATRNQVPW